MSKTKKKPVKKAKTAKSASKSAAKSSSKSVKAKKPAKAASQKAKASAKKSAKSAAKTASKPKVAKKTAKHKEKVVKAKPKKAEKLAKPKTATKPAKTKAPAKAKSVAKETKQKAMDAVLEELIAPKTSAEEEVVLTNADGLRYCKVNECDELATSDTYCRYHYLLNWKKIQLRKKILVGDKLDRYIEELTSRYPDKYLEMIKKDLTTEKDFLAAIQELEIDEGSNEDMDYEDDARSYIDEVRGVGVSTGGDEEEGF